MGQTESQSQGGNLHIPQVSAKCYIISIATTDYKCNLTIPCDSVQFMWVMARLQYLFHRQVCNSFIIVPASFSGTLGPRTNNWYDRAPDSTSLSCKLHLDYLTSSSWTDILLVNVVFKTIIFQLNWFNNEENDEILHPKFGDKEFVNNSFQQIFCWCKNP